MYFHIFINCDKVMSINTINDVKRYTYITKTSYIMTKGYYIFNIMKNLMKNYKNKKK